MDFADRLELLLSDKRVQKIPILFVVQILIACEDLGLIGGDKNAEQVLQPNK